MLAAKGPENSFASEDSIIELSLMMSRNQFEALEQQANVRGLSVAQWLRRLVQDSIDQDELLDTV